MVMKYILAAALLAPFLTVSGTAQDAPSTVKHVYVGGPGSNIPHTTRQINSGGDIFAMGVRAEAPNAYRNGPRSKN